MENEEIECSILLITFYAFCLEKFYRFQMFTRVFVTDEWKTIFKIARLKLILLWCVQRETLLISKYINLSYKNFETYLWRD